MSRQGTTYEDPADARMVGSQSFQYIRGWVYLMATMLGAMCLGFIMVFYAISLWGGMVGLGVGAAETAGVALCLFGYYWVAILVPTSAGLNLSAQVFETEEKAWGCWMVHDTPLTAIPMEEEQRLMPVRIPFGEFSKPSTGVGEEPGLPITEEIRVNCPNPKCDYNKTKFRVDYGEIAHKLPYLQFKTFPYVITPNPGSAPFEKAVMISPCEIDSLRQIRDLIFFKGFPVMARTTFVSLTRVLELDETIPTFGAPCYVVSHSSWHVKIAQQLAGFTPAYMVPTQEQIGSVYNMWGITEAMKLQQQNEILKQRISSLESGLPDFRKAVQAGIAHERKLEELIGETRREVKSRLLQPKFLAMLAVAIISVIIITYLLTQFVFK